MPLQTKWFGFGRDEQYDNAVRAATAGDHETARTFFEHCLKQTRDPDVRKLAESGLVHSLFTLASQLLPSDALNAIGRALELRPEYADLWLCRAVILDQLREIELRDQALADSLRLNPGFANAWMHRVHWLGSNGDWKQAKQIVSEHLATLPSERAERLRDLLDQQITDAEPWNALLKIQSGDVSSELNKAEEFQRASDFESARTLLTDIAAQHPRYPDVRCRLAEVHLELDAVDAAIHELSIAIQINPNYADAHATLGIALRRQGKKEEARSAFRTALDIDPNHVMAREGIRR